MEIPEYTELFHLEGYKNGEDIENLKDLKEADLKAIGISKRGIYYMQATLVHYGEEIFTEYFLYYC